MSYLEGASIDALGALYKVHRATAARWLGRAREQLLSNTRGALSEQLGLADDELSSVMRLIHSRLEVSELECPANTGD